MTTAVDTHAAEIQQLVARSRLAQAELESYSQEQVDRLIRAMVWSVARPGVAEEIAGRDLCVVVCSKPLAPR